MCSNMSKSNIHRRNKSSVPSYIKETVHNRLKTPNISHEEQETYQIKNGEFCFHECTCGELLKIEIRHKNQDTDAVPKREHQTESLKRSSTSDYTRFQKTKSMASQKSEKSQKPPKSKCSSTSKKVSDLSVRPQSAGPILKSPKLYPKLRSEQKGFPITPADNCMFSGPLITESKEMISRRNVHRKRSLSKSGILQRDIFGPLSSSFNYEKPEVSNIYKAGSSKSKHQHRNNSSKSRHSKENRNDYIKVLKQPSNINQNNTQAGNDSTESVIALHETINNFLTSVHNQKRISLAKLKQGTKATIERLESQSNSNNSQTVHETLEKHDQVSHLFCNSNTNSEKCPYSQKLKAEETKPKLCEQKSALDDKYQTVDSASDPICDFATEVDKLNLRSDIFKPNEQNKISFFEVPKLKQIKKDVDSNSAVNNSLQSSNEILQTNQTSSSSNLNCNSIAETEESNLQKSISTNLIEQEKNNLLNRTTMAQLINISEEKNELESNMLSPTGSINEATPIVNLPPNPCSNFVTETKQFYLGSVAERYQNNNSVFQFAELGAIDQIGDQNNSVASSEMPSESLNLHGVSLVVDPPSSSYQSEGTYLARKNDPKLSSHQKTIDSLEDRLEKLSAELKSVADNDLKNGRTRQTSKVSHFSTNNYHSFSDKADQLYSSKIDPSANDNNSSSLLRLQDLPPDLSKTFPAENYNTNLHTSKKFSVLCKNIQANPQNLGIPFKNIENRYSPFQCDGNFVAEISQSQLSETAVKPNEQDESGFSEVSELEQIAKMAQNINSIFPKKQSTSDKILPEISPFSESFSGGCYSKNIAPITDQEKPDITLKVQLSPRTKNTLQTEKPSTSCKIRWPLPSKPRSSNKETSSKPKRKSSASYRNYVEEMERCSFNYNLYELQKQQDQLNKIKNEVETNISDTPESCEEVLEIDKTEKSPKIDILHENQSSKNRSSLVVGPRLSKSLSDLGDFVDFEETKVDNVNTLIRDKIERYVKVCVPDMCEKKIIKTFEDKIETMEQIIYDKLSLLEKKRPLQPNNNVPTFKCSNLSSFFNPFKQKIKKYKTSKSSNKKDGTEIINYLENKIQEYEKKYSYNFTNKAFITTLQDKIEALEVIIPKILNCGKVEQKDAQCSTSTIDLIQNKENTGDKEGKSDKDESEKWEIAQDIADKQGSFDSIVELSFKSAEDVIQSKKLDNHSINQANGLDPKFVQTIEESKKTLNQAENLLTPTKICETKSSTAIVNVNKIYKPCRMGQYKHVPRQFKITKFGDLKLSGTKDRAAVNISGNKKQAEPKHTSKSSAIEKQRDYNESNYNKYEKIYSDQHAEIIQKLQKQIEIFKSQRLAALSSKIKEFKSGFSKFVKDPELDNTHINILCTSENYQNESTSDFEISCCNSSNMLKLNQDLLALDNEIKMCKTHLTVLEKSSSCKSNNLNFEPSESSSSKTSDKSRKFTFTPRLKYSRREMKKRKYLRPKKSKPTLGGIAQIISKLKSKIFEHEKFYTLCNKLVSSLVFNKMENCTQKASYSREPTASVSNVMKLWKGMDIGKDRIDFICKSCDLLEFRDLQCKLENLEEAYSTLLEDKTTIKELQNKIETLEDALKSSRVALSPSTDSTDTLYSYPYSKSSNMSKIFDSNSSKDSANLFDEIPYCMTAALDPTIQYLKNDGKIPITENPFKRLL